MILHHEDTKSTKFGVLINSKPSCPSYYYSSKFARRAQIFWSGISPAKPQRRQGYGERTKTLINDFHSQSPNFAPFASLREILRVSVAAQPHWDLRGGYHSVISTNEFHRYCNLYPNSLATSVAKRSSATSVKATLRSVKRPCACRDRTRLSIPARLGTPLGLKVV